MDPRQGEARALAGYGEVAGRDKLASGGGGDALDGGDHRFWQIGHRLHHLRTSAHQALIKRLAAIAIVAMGGHFSEIMPRREDRPFAGDDDGALNASIIADERALREWGSSSVKVATPATSPRRSKGARAARGFDERLMN
jgi:hypothetical protein